MHTSRHLVLAALGIGATIASKFDSVVDPCPSACDLAGAAPGNWTRIHDLRYFNACNGTLVFDTVLDRPLDPDHHVSIRACTSSDAEPDSAASVELPAEPECTAPDHLRTAKYDLQYGSWQQVAGPALDTSSVVSLLKPFVSGAQDCSSTTLLVKVDQTYYGLWAGADLDKASVADLIERLAAAARDSPGSGRIAAQLCGGERIDALESFGFFADASGNVSAVQEALRTWSQGDCLPDFQQSATWKDVSIKSHRPDILSSITNDTSPSNSTSQTSSSESSLSRRADCHAIDVIKDDGCWALADRCGISQDSLLSFNGGGDFCNTGIKVGNQVCCSSGTLPDRSPQPNSDGSCKTMTVTATTRCGDVADANHMKAQDIEDRNKKTWGWNGCNFLTIGASFCISKGDPPMPNPDPHALCGPTVPGTTRPTNGTDLADLNQCPLNACCDIWGQCGITEEFCTITKSVTGAPGTAAKDTNGCISNCGVMILGTEGSVKSFAHVGYYESWNEDRPCLHMAPKDIDTNLYTHIHYGFGQITSDFKVSINNSDNFQKFLAIKGPKRVLSFGGWSFSTDLDTFPIFRTAVTAAQRDSFATEIVNFVQKNNLDGVDFDWEYPSAPNLPDGVPPGSPDEGPNYYNFLKLVKSRLPQGKTLSIAAPASYWYLKGFPIKDISTTVDYIIYMTYDLHGSWDYNSPFANEGCADGPTGKFGNCLRSHINMTETKYALSMITKAGVPAEKVFVGISSYGRSFKMQQAGCTGPECLFTGPESGAAKGKCTDTSGYISDYEIASIISNSTLPDGAGVSIKQWYEEKTDTDYLVYADTEWVAYMTGITKTRRISAYRDMNFGGVSDWAVDLEADFSSGTLDAGNRNYTDEGPSDPICDLSATYTDLDAVTNANIPSICKMLAVMNVLSSLLDSAVSAYEDANNGYDEKYGYYVKYIKKIVPTAIADCMDGAKGGTCQQYMSCTLNQGDGKGDVTTSCPPPNISDSDIWTLTFKITDEDGFWKTLSDKYGIDKSWVKFGENTVSSTCNSHNTDCERVNKVTKGVPQAADSYDVPNPKDVVKGAVDSVDDLQESLQSTLIDMEIGVWNGSYDDVVQTYSVPVFLIQQAVDSMKQVKDLGNQEQDQERKDMILLIVNIVVCVIPFVGEEAATLAGMANIARGLAIVGETANTVLTVYDIVKDPKQAPLAILGLLLGRSGTSGEVRTAENMGTLAKLRRGLQASTLGPTFKKSDDALQAAIKSCKKS